jgi:hypothetical protein
MRAALAARPSVWVSQLAVSQQMRDLETGPGLKVDPSPRQRSESRSRPVAADRLGDKQRRGRFYQAGKGCRPEDDRGTGSVKRESR